MGFIKIERGITSLSFLTWPSDVTTPQWESSTDEEVEYCSIELEAALPLEQLEPIRLDYLDEEFDCPTSPTVEVTEDFLFDWE